MATAPRAPLEKVSALRPPLAAAQLAGTRRKPSWQRPCRSGPRSCCPTAAARPQRGIWKIISGIPCGDEFLGLVQQFPAVDGWRPRDQIGFVGRWQHHDATFDTVTLEISQRSDFKLFTETFADFSRATNPLGQFFRGLSSPAGRGAGGGNGHD